MATAWLALVNLRAELETRIAARTPNGYSTFKFYVRDRMEQDSSTIDDAFGRERLVEIGDPVYLGWYFIGSDTQGIHVHVPIRIAYPTTGSWPIACIDDSQMLAEYFRDHGSAVTGVGLCVVDPENGITVQPASKDNWQILTIKLLVVLDVAV